MADQEPPPDQDAPQGPPTAGEPQDAGAGTGRLPPPPPPGEPWLGDAPPPDASPAPTGPSTATRVTVLATVIALLIAGAAAAVVLRGGTSAGARLDQIAPAGSLMYARVTLRPAGDQRALVDGLRERFTVDGTDPFERFIDAIDEAMREDGLSADADLRSWVGAEFGFVLTGVGGVLAGGEPDFAVLAAVRDEGAARAALDRIAAVSDPKPVYEIKSGAAFIASSPGALTAATAVVDGSGPAIASDPDFTRALDRLGADSPAVLWADGTKLGELARLLPLPDAAKDSVTGKGAVVLRAERDALVVSGYAEGGTAGGTAGSPALLEAAPADLMGALTFFDLAGFIEGALDGLAATLALGGGFGGAGTLDPGEELAGIIRDTVGLDLDRDIYPWLHGEMSILVGGFTGAAPDVAVLIRSTDDAAAERTFDALRTRLGFLGPELGFELTDTGDGGFALDFGIGVSLIAKRAAGRVVLATSDAYLARVIGADEPALGDDTVYRRAVGPPADDVTFQMYVRVDRIRQLAELFLPAGERADYDTQARPFLEPIEAFGIRATQSGGESTFRMVLTLKGG